MIFKVKGHGHWDKCFTVQHPCEHSRINILQWILTTLGTYLDLKRIWNPINLQGQGHRVKFLGEGIRHALRCPCSSLFYDVFYEFLRKIPFRKRDSHYLNKTREFHNCNFFIFHPNFMWLVAKCSSLWGH